MSGLSDVSCLKPAWGSSTRPAKARRACPQCSPEHTVSLHNSAFAPLGMSATFRAWQTPTGTFQGQFKCHHSPPVFPQAEWVVFLWLWTCNTPSKSSQTTFLNIFCITGTLCWAPGTLKITKTWTLSLRTAQVSRRQTWRKIIKAKHNECKALEATTVQMGFADYFPMIYFFSPHPLTSELRKRALLNPVCILWI